MGLLSLFGILFGIKEVVDEANIKPVPQDKNFDWRAKIQDEVDGVPKSVVDRKMKNNEYYTKDAPAFKIHSADTIVDVEHYEYDKQHFGESYAERMRNIGRYAIKRPKSSWRKP